MSAESGIETVISRLGSFKELLRGIDAKTKTKIIEIRFSVGRPIQLVFRDGVAFLGRQGKFKPTAEKRDFLRGEEIKAIFSSVCEHSVHTYEREICEGFLTIEGGSRVGICGTAVYDKGKIISVKDISSVAIRISHEIIGCADRLAELTSTEGLAGILIAGPPCSGKTTMLRDYARLLASGSCGKFFRTAIVDERMEIAGMYRGESSFDIGITSDVLNGYLKCDGIISAVRALSPDVVVCDEFGSDEDVSASLFAMKSGVKIAAAAHSGSIPELLEKAQIKRLISEGIFSRIVLLEKPGVAEKIYSAKDVLS